MATSFPNLYQLKTATSESTCFICSKFCTSVLTNNSGDWFYVCQGHIKDPSFCKVAPTPIAYTTAPAAKAPGKPAAATAKPPPKAAEKVPPKEKEDLNKPDEKVPGGWLSSIAQTIGLSSEDLTKPAQPSEKPAAEAAPATSAAAPALPPPPKQYILSGNIFYLREQQQRKRAQQRSAATVSSQLPSVPRSAMALPL
ncbi:VPS4-associated protein 1 [Fimicolochytrium jonesii]|uniref:VPS4-associated protein 1 n=1 Tax=Fimicolochytrium jonesii TaxID=1396493 RepID=UPI0022FEE812|nr:VPS4-associated protein 1 [Fimicolochytrium jonesii]KAI8826100.1 VPS4-associated protein 1 [Fimicolochytrium jonesii]